MSWLFGSSSSSTPSPETLKEQTRAWTSDLKSQQRKITREMARIEREENKMKLEMKKMVKANRTDALKIMAKSLLQSRNTRNKMLLANTRINSIILNLKTSNAQMSLSHHLQQSTHVLSRMSASLSLPELSTLCNTMSRELQKQGVMAEMMDEALEDLDDANIDVEADHEIEKVIEEITSGEFAKIGQLKDRRAEQAQQQDDEKNEEEEKARLEMESRLGKLHG